MNILPIHSYEVISLDDYVAFFTRTFHTVSLTKLNEQGREFGWIYRGQTRSKTNETLPLVPKLGRFPFAEAGIPKIGYKVSLREWRRLGAQEILDGPEKTEIEYMTLAQHYGMATCLLDWSLSPLTALWFACRDDGLRTANGLLPDAEVFALQIDTATSQSATGLGEGGLGKGHLLHRPHWIDQRMRAQQSVFTFHPELKPVRPEKFTKELDEEIYGSFEPVADGSLPDPSSGKPVHWTRRYNQVLKDKSFNTLASIKIKSDLRPIVLRQLDAIGVNEYSLFPDKQGLSGYMNWMISRATD